MIKRVYKFFFIWELDKEEAWINDMASHGYSLVSAGRLSFDFEETEPGQYKYKTLFLKGNYYSKKNMDFFSFLDDVGIKVTSYINYPGTCCVYTRAVAEDYPDGINIYSDIDSKITYEWTKLWYMLFCAVVITLGGLLNLAVAMNRSSVWPLNFGTALVCFGLAIVCTIQFIMSIVKIRKFKKERAIHE